jgi:hypothetical protein
VWLFLRSLGFGLLLLVCERVHAERSAGGKLQLRKLNARLAFFQTGFVLSPHTRFDWLAQAAVSITHQRVMLLTAPKAYDNKYLAKVSSSHFCFLLFAPSSCAQAGANVKERLETILGERMVSCMK